MSRPTKSGLDYFPLDADFFCDRKIKRLRRTFGDKGVIVFQFLLCEIYRDKGYYVMYEDSLVIDVANEFGYTENLVRDTISFCATAELFDQRLLDDYQVITSTGIQKRYFEILKQMRRNAVKVVDDYFLLDRSDMPADTVNIISRSKHNCNLGENPGYFGENPGYSGDNATKERKGNKTNTKSQSLCSTACASDSKTSDEESTAAADNPIQNFCNSSEEIPAATTTPKTPQKNQVEDGIYLDPALNAAIGARRGSFLTLLEEIGIKFHLMDGRLMVNELGALVRLLDIPGSVDGVELVRQGLRRLDKAKYITSGRFSNFNASLFLRHDIFIKLINGAYDNIIDVNKNCNRRSERQGKIIEGTDYSGWKDL